MFALTSSDPLARRLCVSRVGGTVWDPELGRALVDQTTAHASALAALAGALLFLAFFPPPSYRRFVSRRPRTASPVETPV